MFDRKVRNMNIYALTTTKTNDNNSKKSLLNHRKEKKSLLQQHVSILEWLCKECGSLLKILDYIFKTKKLTKVIVILISLPMNSVLVSQTIRQIDFTIVEVFISKYPCTQQIPSRVSIDTS